MDDKARGLLRSWVFAADHNELYMNPNDLAAFCQFVKYASRYDPSIVMEEVRTVIEGHYGRNDEYVKGQISKAENFIYFYDMIKKVKIPKDQTA